MKAKQKLTAAYASLALHLQEAAADLSSSDVAKRLSDAVADHFRPTGEWGYYIDHFGDAEAGDVIFSCQGDTHRAPYEISSTAGAARCVIDFEAAEDVVPRTIYEVEADEEDHYAAMEEALRTEGLYAQLPVYERFISKKERDEASGEDFAGKGKSFPILKPEDIMAAVHAMGRAGSSNLGPSGIKARIIAIAKRKGWTKYLPKGWQAGGDTEGKEGNRGATSTGAGAAAGSLALVESAETTEAIVLREARADYPIKLIAPGKGSSAFYPAEVLKRDGPKVFSAGTHVYLNHPTAAEEAARPEGDVSNLAGVLTSTAEYQEAGAKGPGLYARMKVFADHAQMVEEKAAHVGMSIRASGNAVMEAGRPQLRDGVPVLREIVAAESVDVVTRAGAGGMILTEAARAASQSPQQEHDMTLEEAQRLVAAEVAKATAPLIEANMRHEAVAEAGRILSGISLPDAAKTKITARATAALPKTAEGALDVAKLREAVVAEAKAEGQYLAIVTGGGRVIGMGAAPAVQVDPKEAERQQTEAKQTRESEVATFRRLGLSEAAALAAVEGRVA